MDRFDSAYASLNQARGELAGEFLGGHGDDRRPPAQRLSESLVEVAPAGQRGHPVALRELLDDGECALTDGAGGTENGESLQDIEIALKPLVNNLSVPQHGSGQQEGVYAVEHAAVSGQETARVLYAD